MKKRKRTVLAGIILTLALTSTAFAADKTQILRRRESYDQYYFSYDASIVSFDDTATEIDANAVNQILTDEAKNAFYSVSELCTSTALSKSTLHMNYLQTVADLTDRYISVEVIKQLKLDQRQIYNTKEGIVVDLLTGEKLQFEQLFKADSDYMDVISAQMTQLGMQKKGKVKEGQFYLTDTHLVLLEYSGIKDANGTVTREYKIPLENIAFVMKNSF